MQNEKWQPELIGADQFLRQRANGIGMKLRIGRGEIDQVIGMCEDCAELSALMMIKERRISAVDNGRANHCMLFFTKICIALHSIEQARSIAMSPRPRSTCERREGVLLSFRAGRSEVEKSLTSQCSSVRMPRKKLEMSRLRSK